MSDEACTCGHEVEAHGHDPKHPGSTACTEEDCDCCAYESDGGNDADDT
jgi:hypothetical protein